MILVGGDALIDFIDVGAASGLPRYEANPGGSPFNCAVALGKQDCSVGFLTPLSDDRLGRLLHDHLTGAQVTPLAPSNAKPTPLAVVALVDGQPAYQFYRENTADRAVDLHSLQAMTPDAARACQLGSLILTSGDDAEAWAAYYAWLKQERGLFLSLDPNIREAFIDDRATYLTRLQSMLSISDLVKLSDEDLCWILGEALDGDALVAAAQGFAQNCGTALTVLTMGSKGAVAFFGDQSLAVPAATPAVMGDTVGAGDTFMATLLAELDRRGALTRTRLDALSLDDVRAILTQAARAAGINCSRRGCNPPTLAELIGD